MSSATAKYAIPYPTAGDALANGDDTIKALAERVDILMGEAGSDSITPSAANTTTTKRINFSRTYPTIPTVVAGVGSTTVAPGTLSLWVAAIDTSGFTVLVQRTSTTAVPFMWVARP